MSVKVVKKALLMGLNYEGTDFALNGCINDSNNMKNFLISNKYFDESDIVMMNDHTTGKLYPIKENILAQFDKLVKFANNNSDKQVFLFIAYSGHGTNAVDTTGDEADGNDEVLVSLDYDSTGGIIDDEIRSRLIDKLGANVRLVFIGDNCMSGTMADLKYNYKIDASNTVLNDYHYKATVCDVVFISGCRDDQTSADAYLINPVTQKYNYCGAMTASFSASYKDEISTKDLITKMRAFLKKGGFTQIPQISSGKPMDVTKPFLLSIYNN
jgi:hypothetical protein